MRLRGEYRSQLQGSDNEIVADSNVVLLGGNQLGHRHAALGTAVVSLD